MVRDGSIVGGWGGIDVGDKILIAYHRRLGRKNIFMILDCVCDVVMAIYWYKNVLCYFLICALT